MPTTKSKTALLKSAILVMSFVQMGTNGMAPILAQIRTAFPEASDARVQYLMTFPSIFCMFFALSTTVTSRLMTKKTQALCGLAIVALTGVLACLFHRSLTILFFWAALLGVGCGLTAPIAPSLVSELFSGDEQRTLLGWQNSASNIGSMLMTFFGGFLALAGWNYGYLVYLLALPGIVLTLIGLPSGRRKAVRREAAAKPGRFRLVVWREIVTAIAFLMLYSAIPANLAMLVEERQLGSSALSGTLSTLFLLSGIVSGLLFGRISRRLRRFTLTCGVVLLSLGALLLGLSARVPLLALGCVIAGFSISMVMPACMGAASKLPGYEAVNTSLILGLAYVGIFIAPLITGVSASVTGSDAVSGRLLVIAAGALLLAGVTLVLRPGTYER